MTIDLNNLEGLAKPAMTAVCLGLFWTWETLFPFFEFQANRWRHAGRNVAIALMNTMIMATLFGIATVSVANWAQVNQWGLLNWSQIPTPWRILAAILLLDSWLYIWHRLNHRIPLLWRFHRMHHSDPAMDVTTATRFHLGELIASAGIRLGLIPVLGVTAFEVLVSETIVVIATMFHHANISIGKFEPIMRWFIVTPGMHKVHHSRYRPETDSNYSVFLSLWDRLGLTYRQRQDGNEGLELGLDEMTEENWQTIPGMLKTPFVTPKQPTNPKS
ncbi:sterol desaturase family protein [Thalassoglobus sp.]|uniref:sterol desaturase family protein n=1 Tax=Thalassoglobus sp. TaxID=2795869 RepID=UPI003AA8AE41